VTYGSRVNRFLAILRRHGFDLVIVFLVVAAALELWVRPGFPDWPRSALWLDIPAVALLAAPLFARRRFPFGALAAYWVMAAAISFFDPRLIPFLKSTFVLGMCIAFLLGYIRDARQARTGLAIVLAGAAVIVYNLPGRSLGILLFVPLLFGVCWVAGYGLHQSTDQAEAAEVRAAQAEREREAAARVAVAEERARIARELHDIVAHAMSVMVLQVGAVRHRLPEPLAEERDALRAVEQTGRTALSEMRRLLGALGPEGEPADLAPQPGLDRLDALVEEVRRAGLPVRLRREGEPFPLPRPVDLSAYRIAQEGLTNALKHARASKAEVTVGYAPGEVQIEVRDDGHGPGASDGLGHGLVGVRERVKIYGGAMTAGPVPGGGFVLKARLPVAAEAQRT
jgi:signal transduction histidine kinase